MHVAVTCDSKAAVYAVLTVSSHRRQSQHACKVSQLLIAVLNAHAFVLTLQDQMGPDIYDRDHRQAAEHVYVGAMSIAGTSAAVSVCKYHTVLTLLCWLTRYLLYAKPSSVTLHYVLCCSAVRT
jgi:hypothetical protein